MRERSWRAAEAERTLIWIRHTRTKPSAFTGSKSLRKFGLMHEKYLSPGKRALAGRAGSRWPPSMQPSEVRDLQSSLGRVGDACAGAGRGKAGASGMLMLRCEGDSWSLLPPVLGAQQQKRLI